MRALIAFDKFKDALAARAACEVVAAVLRSLHPEWELDLCPLTDGGEGFCETLLAGSAGRIEHLSVRGPRSGTVTAPIGFVSTDALPAAARRRLGLGAVQTLAVVGLATASGLELLPPHRRDPWQTTTFGTGELLAYAAQEKADAIVLGIGGSATNDLGLGALTALGANCHDAHEVRIPTPKPANWATVRRIDLAALRRLPPLFIACDVTNPLLGPSGAAATFGAQKGLQPLDLPRLEAQAARMAGLLCQASGKPLSLVDAAGAGAAGGIAFGLMVAVHAKLVPGFDFVSEWLDLPARIAAADLIITGEGRFDTTSLSGKGPGSLVREAQRLGKPAYVFAGSIELTAGVASGIKNRAITPEGMSLAEALPRTAEFLATEIRRVL